MGTSDHGTTYMRVAGHDGELRPWHYIYVCSIESRLITRVRYDSQIRIQHRVGTCLAGAYRGTSLIRNSACLVPRS